MLYLALPPAVAALAYSLFGIVLVAAVLRGVFTGRLSTGRGAWLVFALANALWVIGDVWTGALEVRASDGVAPFPSIADAVYLAGFPVLAIATIWAARLRGLHRDPVAALDGFMVAAAAAVPIWVLWVSPVLRASDPEGMELVVTLAYPAMDLLLIGCGTRFVLGGGRWNRVTVLMVAGLAINIVSDIAYNGAVLAGTYAMPDPIDLGFLLAYLVWALGALDPDAHTFAEGGHRINGVSYRARTWALVAIVICPLSVLAVAYVQGDPVDGGLVAGAFAAICGAMVLRLRLIARGGSSAWRGPALLSAAALVVVVAAVGLTSLQQQSIEANTNAQGLAEAVIVAERLDAIAMRTVSGDPELGLAARGLWRSQIAELRLRLAALDSALTTSEQRTLEELLSRYEQALALQLQAVDMGSSDMADRLIAEQVKSANQAFILQVRASMRSYQLEFERAARETRLSTVLELALSGLLLTLLLVRFGGVGRRAELAHQALHDPLTGLPNRLHVEERLRRAITRTGHDGTRYGFVLLDLDDFRAVNDSLGHPVGNELLNALADRLRGCVRPGETLARIGGDEFAIMSEDIDGDGSAIATAQCMLKALATPFEVGGTMHLAHASVGIAVCDASGPGTDAERAASLLRDAELAMYAAKEREGNTHELFTAEMHDAVANRLELKAELARAILNEEFTLVYQPLVDIAAQRIVGYEALVRWVHPERGFVSPAEFIPLAEQTGLIVDLGAWVLNEACRQLAEWRQDGWAQDRYVSVNVAGNQLQREDFPQQVRAALDATGLPASVLLLEVTESSLILDIDGSQRRMQAIRDLGVRFAIDDFGTGYSSLSYLSKFPLDVLKIDKSFTDEITTGARGRAIVDAIVNMATSLDLKVVAEGIEEPEQVAVLADMRCELGQGYFYARPLPPADVPGFDVEPQPLRLAQAS